VSDDRAPVRSYQRIFRPERRIYQVEGRRLPVPGGVPLSWLGYALGGLLAVLVLSGRSWTVAALLAACAGVAGWLIGGRSAGAIAAAVAVGAAQLVGFVLGTLDWPLRVLIVPALVATLATQATPDGRPAHRYALSWLALQLRPARRSLGRPLPTPGEPQAHSAVLGVTPDWRGPRLRRGRVRGPAVVHFATPLFVRDGRGLLGRRLRADSRGSRWARRGTEAERVELAVGERLELRP
jgi:hypothetical protein